MSRLIGPMFEGSPLLLLPLVALGLFVAVFTLVVVRLFVRSAAAFDEAARAPLEDEHVRVPVPVGASSARRAPAASKGGAS